jgi:hypothetical protein
MRAVVHTHTQPSHQLAAEPGCDQGQTDPAEREREGGRRRLHVVLVPQIPASDEGPKNDEVAEAVPEADGFGPRAGRDRQRNKLIKLLREMIAELEAEADAPPPAPESRIAAREKKPRGRRVRA